MDFFLIVSGIAAVVNIIVFAAIGYVLYQILLVVRRVASDVESMSAGALHVKNAARATMFKFAGNILGKFTGGR